LDFTLLFRWGEVYGHDFIEFVLPGKLVSVELIADEALEVHDDELGQDLRSVEHGGVTLASMTTNDALE
jgi:hypothetical protein